MPLSLSRHQVVLSAVAAAAVLLVATAESASTVSTAEGGTGSLPTVVTITRRVQRTEATGRAVGRNRDHPLGSDVSDRGRVRAVRVRARGHARRATRCAAGHIPRLHVGDEHPATVVLGVSYHEALGNGWLLKDAGGACVMNVTYGTYVGDVGDAAYQRRFLNNVTEFLQRTKLDGVFIDDVLGHPLGLTGASIRQVPDGRSVGGRNGLVRLHRRQEP